MSPEDRQQLIDEAAYIVWLDYGTEGWKPEGFTSWSGVEGFLLQGGHGVPMIITRGALSLEPPK